MKSKSDINQKQIYLWNLLGNVSAAAVSVLYLMIVSRMLMSQEADIFSLAYSLGHLWVIIGLFQVRNYQGTDVSNEHLFLNYVQGRMLTTFIMLVTFIPYLFISSNGRYSMEQLIVFVLIVLYRACDAVSDVFQGLFQQRERLDIAGKAMVYRYSGSVIIFTLMLSITKSLTPSLIVLLIWNTLFVYFYDFIVSRQFEKLTIKEVFNSKYYQGTLEILKSCFPLFLNGFLLNYMFNEPKLVIESGLLNRTLPAGMQRDFNILFMPVFFMSLCILVVRPLITQLAKLWANNQITKFNHITIKLIGSIILGTFAVTVLTFLIGVPVLSLLFSVDLSNYTFSLVTLVFSGGLYAVAIVLENIITILRKHKYVVVNYMIMFVVSKMITEPLIQQFHMLGASISFLVTMLVYVISMLILWCFIRRLVVK